MAFSHIIGGMTFTEANFQGNAYADEAAGFRPYSVDPEAPMIEPDLADDMSTTKDTLTRHERNLQRFQQDELNIVARFDGDIDRFKALKGLD